MSEHTLNAYGIITEIMNSPSLRILFPARLLTMTEL